MEHAYAAIGRAVYAAQLFETVLVPIFEFFKMQTKPGYLEKTQGYISAGAFKVPPKRIVNTLSDKGNIATDLEERLSKYIEDRNTLIHRWVLKHGWPDDKDANGFAPIIELANRVKAEANSLTDIFTGYMIKFTHPDWVNDHKDEYEERIAKLFHRAHIEG